jgi:heme A synthase
VHAAAGFSLFFMLTEAAVGAGLVLFEYVAGDASIGRAYWMAAHLVNTFLLLAAQTLTAWWASGAPAPILRGQQPVSGALVASLVAMLVLGASGAVTALGDTLMLNAGLTPDSSPFVAQLKALRVYHPLLAILTGALVVGASWYVRSARPGPVVEQLVWALTTVYVAQLLVGALNVRLMAPVWLQLVHLLLADAIWIGLVLLTSTALARSPLRAPVLRVKPQQT